MITDRDITTRVVAEAADPKTTSVGDVYSQDLISIEPDNDLEHGFDRDAQIKDIAHEIDVDGANPCASIGREHDEAFALELTQRLAHRHVAHRVARGQQIEREPTAERQCPSDDVITHTVADRYRGRAETFFHDR